MKILIENTVPLNNGDAALIFSIGDEFQSRGYDVYYSTPQFELAQRLYPNKKWLNSPLSNRITKVPFIGYLFLLLTILSNRKLKEFNAVISAPGGYVNSYYSSLKRKLQLMYLYKRINNQKIYLYSQSIGPLNSNDEEIIKKYFPIFDLIYARDAVSKKRLDDLSLTKNVEQTKDAAFLLERIIKQRVNDKKIAISVREWSFDDRNEGIYISLIKKITEYFYNEGYRVVFLSTCQGIEDYKDDSKTAVKIVEQLPDHLKDNIEIDSKYYNLYELRKELNKYSYVVGTRLHMCILSWLSSTPAFNISYEEKGKEAYDYMGLEKYSVDYNYTGDINEPLSDFMKQDYNETFKQVDNLKKESLVYLNKVVEDINL